MDLRALMVETKSVWVEHPEIEGFEVEIATLNRKEVNKLRKSCTTSKWDKHARGTVESVDDKKFVELFTKRTILDWKGLTLGKMSVLALMELGDIDPDTEVPFSNESALALVEESADFDLWVNEVIFNLDNFRS